MSTYYGYVCLSHDPPLHSEHWLNRGEDTLRRFLAAWRAGGYTADTYPLPKLPVHRGWDGDPAEWLAAHPNCRIGIGNENGEIVEVPA